MPRFWRSAVVCLAFGVTGCTAAMITRFGGIPKSSLDALIGQPVGDVVAQWGAPNRSAMLPDSTSVYTWEITGATRTAYSADYSGGVSAESHTPTCVKSLIVSAQGKIVRWTANNGCPIVRDR